MAHANESAFIRINKVQLSSLATRLDAIHEALDSETSGHDCVSQFHDFAITKGSKSMDKKCKNALGDTALEFALAVSPVFLAQFFDVYRYDNDKELSGYVMDAITTQVWKMARMLAEGAEEA